MQRAVRRCRSAGSGCKWVRLRASHTGGLGSVGEAGQQASPQETARGQE